MKTTLGKADMTIGVLAQRTGCNVPTIRYYEEIGLIPQARRRPSGHRVYGQAAHELLTFIRRCRDFGFPLEQVRKLVSLAGSEERDCVETRDIAQGHLSQVRAKLTELQSLERALAQFVKSCNAQCLGGPAAKCTILRTQAPLGELGASPSGCCG